jgi:hypothetical protein
MAATATMDGGVIDEIPESIDSSTSSTSDEPFRLLDLPPKLVARTTGFVNSEGLISTRLACKALEAITFERFAAESFEHIYCWIQSNQDFDRLKNIIRLSPRLSSRIRQLTLTGDALRERPLSTITHVCDDDLRVDRSRYWTMVTIYFQVKECVRAMNVLRTLQDIKNLPQQVLVAIDLAIYSHSEISREPSPPCCSPEQVALFSLALS